MKYLLLFLIITFASAADDAFITPNQLVELKKEKNLILLDVSSYSSYTTSHVDGAVHVNISKFVESTYSGMIISFSSIIQRELVKLGINKDSKVVIYSRNTQQDQLNSSYLALMLINYGFENVSILDGGYMAWLFEYDTLVSSKLQTSSNNGDFKIKDDKKFIVNTQHLKKNLYNSHFIVSRESSKFNDISGHIASAKSYYYKDNFFDDLTIKSDPVIENNFINILNLKKHEEIIVYGDTVFDASMNWYILYKKFGFSNAKLYEKTFDKLKEEKFPLTIDK